MVTPEEEKAAKAKQKAEADAMNIASLETYPSLGSAPPRPKTTMNYGKTVAEAAARIEASEAAARSMVEEEATGLRLPPRIRRCAYPTGPTYEEEEEEEEEGYEEGNEEEGNAGEYNADLTSGRRRGDKGIW